MHKQIPPMVRGILLMILGGLSLAQAQTPGGTWQTALADDPVSASIHEEAAVTVVRPFMGVYNNLIIFDQHIARASPETIRPELATSWAWSEDGKTLTFKLRPGVKWHDGKLFTSADVKCTWDTLGGRRDAGWRKNPRGSWWRNVAEVVTDGELGVIFKLSQKQPALLGFFASGFSPVYPCHVAGKDMRTMPIGTGPFKVASFSRGAGLKLVKNPDYWKAGRPYLDAINWRLITSPATMALAFRSGELDWAQVQPSLVKELQAERAKASCQSGLSYSSYYLLMNSAVAPFNDIKVRRALNLAIDRSAFVKISDGALKVGTSMLPAPAGLWGPTAAEMAALPGYGNTAKNLAEAQRMMREAGYGPDKPLKIQLSTRQLKAYTDASVVVIDQLRKVYIEATSDVQETSIWYANLARKKIVFGVDAKGAGIDDPDDVYSSYLCSSPNNSSGTCNKDIDAKIEAQSVLTGQSTRKKLVIEIDRQLQEEAVRPILFYNVGSTCTQPYVKGYSYYDNGQFNHWRFEDVWLDKRK